MLDEKLREESQFQQDGLLEKDEGSNTDADEPKKELDWSEVAAKGYTLQEAYTKSGGIGKKTVT